MKPFQLLHLNGDLNDFETKKKYSENFRDISRMSELKILWYKTGFVKEGGNLLKIVKRRPVILESTDDEELEKLNSILNHIRSGHNISIEALENIGLKKIGNKSTKQ